MDISHHGVDSRDFLHPRIYVEQQQERLDTLWETIEESIEWWNLLLRDAHQRGLEQDEFERLKYEAITTLDSLWPFTGDYFLVTGKWYVPTITVEGSNIQSHFTSEPTDAFNIAPSAGFDVVDIDSVPKIVCTFAGNKIHVESPSIRGPLQGYCVAAPEQISLQFVRPAEVNDRPFLERVSETLPFYDRILQLYLSNPSSSFFRESNQKQFRFLEGISDDVSDIVTAPGHLLSVDVVTPYSYVRSESSTAYGYKKVTHNDPSIASHHKGDVVGATILETAIVQSRALKSVGEMIDHEAGLCLIVRPTATNITSVHPGELLLVPTRQVVKLGLFTR